jgi:hypothetical protein
MNEPLKKHLCVCGHEETYHKEGDGYCFGFSCRNGVGCIAFRPAPSQPSMEEIISNPANIEKAAKKSNEMQRKTVRDEKIARIVKEFREKFTYHPDGVWNPETARIELPEYIPLTIENVEAWLTQTLTTLLNEE